MISGRELVHRMEVDQFRFLVIDMYPGRIFMITDVPRHVRQSDLISLYDLSFSDRIKRLIYEESNSRHAGRFDPMIYKVPNKPYSWWKDEVRRLSTNWDKRLYSDVVMGWGEMVEQMTYYYGQRYYRADGDFVE